MKLPLLCPVQDCHGDLERQERRFVCHRGHSFDVSRSGYVNFLQPQERRSKQPGDSAAAVQARRRLHERGLSQPLLAAVSEILEPRAEDTILDAGCGDGFYLGTMAETNGFLGIGVDISVPAVDAAARRYPHCQWIVANADRFIPCADASVSAVISITGRMNEAEFRRVLRPGGRLLVAVPAEEDLIELRGAGRSRMDRTREAFASQFTFLEQRRAMHTAELDAEAVKDLGLAVYLPRSESAVRSMKVTFALDLLRFAPR